MLTHDQHAQLTTLFDLLDLPVWSADPYGTVTWVNRAFEAIAGPGLPGEADCPFARIVHPEDRALMQGALSRAARTGQSSLDLRLRVEDGPHRQHRCDLRPWHHDDGTVAGWFATCTDVHAQRVQEQRCVALNRVSEELTTLSGVPAVLSSLVTTGLHAAGAQQACVYLMEGDRLVPVRSSQGTWDDEAGGIAQLPPLPTDLLSGGAVYADPSELAVLLPAQHVDTPPAHVAVMPLAVAGETYGAAVLAFDHGTDADARRHLEVLCSQYALALGHAREQERQQRSDVLLDTLVDALPVALGFFDPQLRHVLVNTEMATLNELSVEEHLGRTLEEVAPQIAVPIGAMLEQVLETGEPVAGVPISGAEPGPDGITRQWLVSFYPVRDRHGQMLGAGLVATETTDEFRAYEAARASDARFRLFAENASDLIARLTPDGHFLYASPSYRRVLGHEPESLVGRPYAELLVPEDLPLLNDSLTRLGAGAAGITFTHHARTLDGRTLWLESTFNALRGPEGTLAEAQVATRDVTARVNAERALLDSEARYRALVENAGVGVASLGPDGRWLDVNPAMTHITGFSREALLGMTHADVVGNPAPDPNTEPAPPMLALLANGELDTFSQEQRWTRSDGTRMWVNVTTSAVRDDSGHLRYAVMVVEDVTDRKHAETELRSSREQLALAFDAARLGLWDWDIMAGHETWTPEQERLYGLPPGAFGGRNEDFLNRLHPDDRDRVRRATLDVLQHGTDYSDEYRVIWPDGEERWLRSVGRVYRNGDGTPARMTGVNYDITERKHAERARHQLAQLVQASSDFVGIATLDHTLLYINDAGEHLLGLNQLLVRPTLGIADLVWPDDHALLHEVVLPTVIRDGRWTGDLRVRAFGRDTAVPMSVNIFAFSDVGTARPLALAVVARDLRERQAAEAAIRAQAERLREQAELLSLANEVMIVRDAHDVITEWNAAARAAYGYTDTEAVGRVVHELLQPQTALPAHEIRAQLALTGFWEGQVVYRRKDGQEIVMLSRQACQHDDRGTIRAILEVNWDITPRVQAEQAIRDLNAQLEERVEERTARLQELHAELSAFATSMSRDIQEPLRRISGFVQLLEKRLGGALDERAADYLRHVQVEAGRVGRLVDDLHQLAHFGRQELELERVPLAQMVVQVRSDLEAFIRGRRVEWALGELPVVTGDMMLLRQMLAALLHNAIKFTRGREPARIEVGSETRAQETVVWVRDNGVGFDPADAHRLFKVFQRLHDERYGGAGVGLANVRRIVTRHGGRVWAEGRPGEGATFYFTLPLT